MPRFVEPDLFWNLDAEKKMHQRGVLIPRVCAFVACLLRNVAILCVVYGMWQLARGPGGRSESF